MYVYIYIYIHKLSHSHANIGTNIPVWTIAASSGNLAQGELSSIETAKHIYTIPFPCIIPL